VPKFWKSKEFEEAQRVWEAKLKESGFKDIEKRLPTGTEQRALNPANRDRQEAEAEYYRLISLKVSEEELFENEMDRLIMERIAEGKKITEISAELKAKLPPGKQRSRHNRRTIRYIRRRYENKWGIRSWKPEQMRPRKPPTK
jgi:hypothetical protein